jgi:hypothetical protein
MLRGHVRQPLYAVGDRRLRSCSRDDMQCRVVNGVRHVGAPGWMVRTAAAGVNVHAIRGGGSSSAMGAITCCQHSCTRAASVLLLAPDPKDRRGQSLLQRGGVTLLLHTGVRGTMVGVQARARAVGEQKVNKKREITGRQGRKSGERGHEGAGGCRLQALQCCHQVLNAVASTGC